MPMLLGEYKALLFSPTGTLRAEFDNWRYLSFRHLLNAPDYAEFAINGNDSRTAYFEKNAILEFWRRVPGYAPLAIPADRQREGDWYCEWEGLHSDEEHTTYVNGDSVFISRSDGYLDFTQRREVLYHASETLASPAKKIGIPTQTAMYQFVIENCGSLATAANGRFINGVIAGLTVAAMTGEGLIWSGGRAYRNVLDILIELSAYANIDFDIIGKGGANWEFVTYPDQLGKDRTVIGLDSTTGLNGAGNPPVIFSLEANNVSQMTRKTTYRGSANVVAAMGKGLWGERDYALSVDTAEIDATRVNQREITRNASTQDSPAELSSYAYGVARQLDAITDFSFIPMITPATIYGVHYWWTDRVTAYSGVLEKNKRLVGLTIRVDQNGEQFSEWDFETYPRL